MNISSVGASSSLDLISLLSKQRRASGSGESGTDATSDSVSLSMQAQFMQGAAQLQADFQNLGSAIQSGDLESAKKAYATMQDKMSSHRPPSGGDDPMAQDFAALGKALDSGDTQAAQSAYKAMQTKMDQMKSMMGASSSSTSMGQDMDELGKLIDSGNLNAAKSLFKSMQSKMRTHQATTQKAQATDLESLFSSLGTALNSNDLSSAQDSWNTLLQQIRPSGNSSVG